MKKSYVMYTGWTPMIQALSDEDAGKLLKAITAYQGNLEYQIENPMLAAIFEMIRSKFEEDRKAYEETCKQNRENGKKGGRPRKATETEGLNKKPDGFSEKRSQAKKAEYEYEYDYDSDSLKEKPSKEGKKKADPVGASEMSEPMKEKTREWLRYKTERREPYKQTGLQTLVNRIAREERTYGTEAVMRLIDDSMSNGWRGIIWDRLNKPGYGARDAPTKPLTGFDALIEMERAANEQG